MLPAFLDSIIVKVYEGVLCNSCCIRMHWRKKQGAVAHSFSLYLLLY